jgi:hypothetical protein
VERDLESRLQPNQKGAIIRSAFSPITEAKRSSAAYGLKPDHSDMIASHDLKVVAI